MNLTKQHNKYEKYKIYGQSQKFLKFQTIYHSICFKKYFEIKLCKFLLFSLWTVRVLKNILQILHYYCKINQSLIYTKALC